MSVALNAQLLKPRLTCLPNKPPFSHRNCMRMIYNKKADITMLEAGDIYRAGEDYGLIPIMAEVRLLSIINILCYKQVVYYFKLRARQMEGNTREIGHKRGHISRDGVLP